MRISDWSSDVCSSDLGDDDLMRIAARVLDVEEAFAARAAALVDNHQRLVHELVLLHDALDHAGHLVGTATGTGRNDELDSLRRLPLEIGRASCRERVCQYV